MTARKKRRLTGDIASYNEHAVIAGGPNTRPPASMPCSVAAKQALARLVSDAISIARPVPRKLLRIRLEPLDAKGACPKLLDRLGYGRGRAYEGLGWAIRLRLIGRYISRRCQPVSRRSFSIALLVAAATVSGATQTVGPRAQAAPAPEVEYLYDVTVRRHYNFPTATDALSYGLGICDKVTRGESYAQVMGDVKSDVTPTDEFAANYLVSYAVNLLCPAEIWQLRNSAAHYQPPAE